MTPQDRKGDLERIIRDWVVIEMPNTAMIWTRHIEHLAQAIDRINK